MTESLILSKYGPGFESSAVVKERTPWLISVDADVEEDGDGEEKEGPHGSPSVSLSSSNGDYKQRSQDETKR